MTDNKHVARAWLKVTCPFSFKFLLFMTEAGLLEQIEVIACDPQADNFEQIRSDLAAGTGDKASFPTVEIEPRVFMTESDDLIQYYAGKNGLEGGEYPVLEYYKAGVFQRVLGLFRENKELKASIQQL